MKNRSRVIGVVVVLGLAYTGASWYVGQRAQATVEQVVEQANERLVKVLGPNASGQSPKLEITQYQRGIFSSEALYTLHMQDEAGKPFELVIKDHLLHGPLPLGAMDLSDMRPALAYSRAQLVRSDATQKWFDSQKAESPFMAQTRIGFNGTGHSALSFAPVEFAQPGQALNFSGGSIDIQFSNEFNDNESSGQFESLVMDNTAAGEKIVVNDVRLAGKTSTDGDKTVTVQSGATIGNVAVHSEGQDDVSIEKMTADLNSVQKAQMLDGEFRYGFGQIIVGEANLGSIALGAGIKQLDVGAATALVEAYNAIRVAHGAQNDEALRPTPEEEALVAERLSAVLATNPILMIDPVLWKNAEGESQGTLEVQLMPASQAAATQEQLALLLAETLKRVKLDLSVSRAMFVGLFVQASGHSEDAEQMKQLGGALFDQYANRLERAGLVLVEDGSAITNINYEENTVNVNGQAMPASEFMQRLIIAAM